MFSDNEQQPERPPGIQCPNCGFHIDCEMVTGFIQAGSPVTCVSCFFGQDNDILTEWGKSVCPSPSNQ